MGFIPQPDNTIIAYFRNKAIAVDEWDNLFFAEIPKEFVILGEVLPSSDIKPISCLSDEEQQEIIEFVENGGVIWLT